MKPNKLFVHWATTRCGPFSIHICKNANPKFTDSYNGLTTKVKGLPSFYYQIEIADHIFDNPARFNEILLHEFTHVLEFIHEHDFSVFSPTQVGECTALAQTVGAGLGEMLTRMEQHPQEPKRKAKSRRKAGTAAPKRTASKRRSASSRAGRTSRR